MRQPGRIHFAIEERTPFAEGEEFGAAGAYEILNGRVRVEVDPASVQSGAIADIEYAPRNEDGLIACIADFAILKPRRMIVGNGRILFDYANRGSKRALQYFNDAPMTNKPVTRQHAGNGYLMRRGYSVLWLAWQGDLQPGDGRLLLDLPIARAGEMPIRGPVRSEYILDEPGTATLPLSGKVTTRSHPVVSLDTSRALLTRRRYPWSKPELVPAGEWQFAREEKGVGIDFFSEEKAIIPSDSHIHLKSGFAPGWIYELTYEGRDPLVLGLGHAVVRDVVGFLKYRSYDDSGENNPLFEGALPDKAYAWGRSQTGRCLRDFLYHGFNADAEGRRIFDGGICHVSGAGRINMGRFANLNAGGSQQYEDHGNACDQYPFAYTPCHDPMSGKFDAIFKRPKTDPLLIHTQSSTEYWQRRGSLVHTDATGNDLPEPDNVRLYLWASTQHALDPSVERPRRGRFENYTNIVQTSFLFRALLDALDRWASGEGTPPESRVPRRRDATLVTLEEWRAGFPAIPGVSLPSAPNDLERPLEPVTKEAFPVLVPATDSDGNEIAGIRAPMVAAPLGTYTGWNMRTRGFGHGALHNFDGSYIPFPETADLARTSGDPRKSVIERYRSADEYIAAIRAAAEQLVREGLMLEEDIARAVKLAANWSRPRHDVQL